MENEEPNMKIVVIGARATSAPNWASGHLFRMMTRWSARLVSKNGLMIPQVRLHRVRALRRLQQLRKRPLRRSTIVIANVSANRKTTSCECVIRSSSFTSL